MMVFLIPMKLNFYTKSESRRDVPNVKISLYPVENLNSVKDLKPTGYFYESITNKHE